MKLNFFLKINFEFFKTISLFLPSFSFSIEEKRSLIKREGGSALHGSPGYGPTLSPHFRPTFLEFDFLIHRKFRFKKTTYPRRIVEQSRKGGKKVSKNLTNHKFCMQRCCLVHIV